MQKTRIETFDFTWNPLGWGCWGPGGSAKSPKRCWFCYAKRFADRGMSKCEKCSAFEPHFHPERGGEPAKLQKPSRIFVCDMSDPFGDWVPRWQIELILDVALGNLRHTFFFLTKQPWNMAEFAFPRNSWVGATITRQEDVARAFDIASLSPQRVKGKRFLSIEPLLSSIVIPQSLLRCFDWIIIGALTGYGESALNIWPWVRDLTRDCLEANVPVFHKNSLLPLLGGDSLWRRDLP